MYILLKKRKSPSFRAFSFFLPAGHLSDDGRCRRKELFRQKHGERRLHEARRGCSSRDRPVPCLPAGQTGRHRQQCAGIGESAPDPIPAPASADHPSGSRRIPGGSDPDPDLQFAAPCRRFGCGQTAMQVRLKTHCPDASGPMGWGQTVRSYRTLLCVKLLETV